MKLENNQNQDSNDVNVLQDKRVCHLIWALEAGGAERQVVNIVKWQKSQGMNPFVVCLTRKGLFAEELEKEGVPVFLIEKKPGLDFSVVFKLSKFMKLNKIEILHTHVPSASFWGRLAAKLAGIQTVYVSEHSALCTTDKAFRFINQLFSGGTTRYFVVSDQIKNAMRKQGIDPSKVITIHNGISLDVDAASQSPESIRNELNISPDDYVVGIVGRLEYRKDHKSFLKACSMLKQSNPDIKVLVVGDGPLREELVLYASSIGLEGAVNFLGTRTDIANLLSAMNAFVLSSLTEGISISLLEAMSAGVPCVVTNVGGNPEVIEDKQNGRLVEVSNPRELKLAIADLMLNPSDAKKLSDNAKITVEERFSVARMMRDMDEAYKFDIKHAHQEKYVFILSQFPCYDEAFILRELDRLAETTDYSIFSLRRSKDPIIHGIAEKLLPRSFSIPFFLSLRLWSAYVRVLFKYPRRFFSALTEMIVGNIKSPEFLIKNIVLFPKAIYLSDWIGRHKITHMHAYWATFPASVAMIASKITGVPFSFTGHAHDIYLDTTHLKEKMEKATFISTCTKGNKEYLEKIHPAIHPEKVQVIHHGLDLNKFAQNLNKSDEVFEILSVGTLQYHKGFEFLIKMAGVLRDRGEKFHVSIVGGGPLEQDLKEHIRLLKLENYVTMVGPVKQEEVIPFYQKAHLFMLLAQPEWHWGIPNVCIEAFACKAPVVTTKFGSVEELVLDGKTGYIVPPKEPEKVADIVAKLMKDKELRQKMAEEGFRMVNEEFDLDKLIGSYIQGFDSGFVRAVSHDK